MTVNECKYIREETNIFIAPGSRFLRNAIISANGCSGKAKTIRTSTGSMLGQEVSPLTSMLHSILEWTGKESIVAMITAFIFCLYAQYHSGW